MDDTAQRSPMDRYRLQLDQRMIALAALGFTEDFYAIPLRKAALGELFLNGAIPLPQPGRRLQLELRMGQDVNHQPCITAKLSGLLGLGFSGKRCQTTLIKETHTTLGGVFDFGKVVFRIRVVSHAGPHPVAAIATLEQVLADDGSSSAFVADALAPCSPCV